MSIGTTIKQLRKEKNITQEQLAEYLGITSRAISQWECDRTSPDISQLPALANIFEVSADVLLGIDVTQKEKKIADIVKNAGKCQEIGHLEEAISIFRTGLLEFPNSHTLMRHLVECLTHMLSITNNEEKKRSLIQEGISFGEKILEECTNDNDRHMTIQSLCQLYKENGEPEKAINLAWKMPSRFGSMEFLLANIYTGTKRYERLKENLFITFSSLQNDLFPLNDPLDDGTLPYTNKEYIQILEKYLAIIDIVFEDKNYGFSVLWMGEVQMRLAMYYLREEQIEEAIRYMWSATRHAIWYDTEFRADGAYTSLLFRGIDFGGIHFNINANNCLLHLKKLELPEFDSIREHPEFKKIIEELQKYGKEL
ncbi:MAG: helix-turn-helix transcriptional regulator [Lachnospiraceae bacterium]|nr:helix-turn-helix transcriptional regulator [Lachnospiraceae bacterium]